MGEKPEPGTLVKKSRLDDLFEFAKGEVTDADIRRYCPGDPGYENYVNLCLGVRRSGRIPDRVDPDWFEVFCMAQCRDPGGDSDRDRFIRFKLFCGAIAAKFLLKEPGLDPVVIVNYVCCSLVTAARELQIIILTKILADVFPVLARELKDYRAPSGWVVEEYPFCLLAGMMMAQDLRRFEQASDLAGQLIEAEGLMRVESYFPGREFLMGLTNYDSLHGEWLGLAKSLENSEGSEAVRLVIDALNGVERWRK